MTTLIVTNALPWRRLYQRHVIATITMATSHRSEYLTPHHHIRASFSTTCRVSSAKTWRNKPWLITSPFEKEPFFNMYRREIDKKFTEEAFITGAKTAIERITEALSQGRFEEIIPLMEQEELDRVAYRYAKMSKATRQWLRIDTRDLLVCKLNIYGHYEGPAPWKEGETYAYLTVSMAGFHGAQRLPDDGRKMKESPALVDTFAWRVTLSQRARPPPDENTPWRVAQLTASYNPFGYMPQFVVMKQCAKLRLTVL